MYPKHLHPWLLLALLSLAPSRALAWVETAVQSHTVRVELDRLGSATVGHEFVLRVRGGPLKSLTLSGVDADAEFLPDATVAVARADFTTTRPLLLEKAEDGSLAIEIDHDKGLRSGTYLFRFRYRTHLTERQLLKRRGAWVELTWTAPRFENGIDSARAVFAVPSSATPPRLPVAAENANDFDPALDGVLVASERRADGRDEIELVRPHLAQNEPAIWRVWLSPRAIDALGAETPTQALVELAAAEPDVEKRPALPIVAALLAALGYALLIALKGVLVARDCRSVGAVAKPLVPLGAPVRSVLGGLLLGTAVGVALLSELSVAAAVLLLAAMSLAAHTGPLRQPALRGPGTWIVCEAKQAFSRAPRCPTEGRWLDTGDVRGFLLFALGLTAFAAAGSLLLSVSPYHAALLWLSSACLIPVFCCGRAAERPQGAVERAQPLLGWLYARLLRRGDVDVEPLLRLPGGVGEPDELRLRVLPKKRERGLGSIEVGLETVFDSAGPCVIVRVSDDSAAYRALPRTIVWSRGRSQDERVAILRPKLPTRALSLRLVANLLDALQPRPGARPACAARVQRPRRAASSAGSGVSTTKAATPRAPLQAT
ncbi:MAG TPA: hypothetical protein VF989_11370 [Polyangiaceae bacterium]